MTVTSFPGAYPDSAELYSAVRVRVALATDDARRTRRIALRVAETVERALSVNGSSVTYGAGRWSGAVERGATVETCAPAATATPAVISAALDAVRELVTSAGLSAFATVETVVAAELY